MRVPCRPRTSARARSLTEAIGRAVGHLSFWRGSGDPARLPSVTLRLLVLSGRTPRRAPTPGRLCGRRPTGRRSHGSRAVSPAGSQAVSPHVHTDRQSPGHTGRQSHGTRAVNPSAGGSQFPRLTGRQSFPGTRAVSPRGSRAVRARYATHLAARHTGRFEQQSVPLGSQALCFKLGLTWPRSAARMWSRNVAGPSLNAAQRWASATAEAIPTWHGLHGFRGAGSRPARGRWYRLAARRPVEVPARGPWPLAGLEVDWQRLQALQRHLLAAIARLLSPVWAEPWSAAFAASRPLPTPPAGGLHSGYCTVTTEGQSAGRTGLGAGGIPEARSPLRD